MLMDTRKRYLYSAKRDLCFFQAIAIETARMSYPGSFSGRLLKSRAKDAIVHHFKNNFPEKLKRIWDGTICRKQYDRWHKERVNTLSRVVGRYKRKKKDTSFAISAKLLNTFMHQLMKYEKFRHLYKQLHLPLDKQVFVALRRLAKDENYRKQLVCLKNLVNENPYRIDTKGYGKIQQKLWEVVGVYNKGLPKGCKLRSRIDLNCLLWSRREQREVDDV